MAERLTKSDIEKIEKEIEYRKLVVRKEAIEAVKAVSYTHLDVYKRQLLCYAIQSQ